MVTVADLSQYHLGGIYKDIRENTQRILSKNLSLQSEKRNLLYVCHSDNTFTDVCYSVVYLTSALFNESRSYLTVGPLLSDKNIVGLNNLVFKEKIKPNSNKSRHLKNRSTKDRTVNSTELERDDYFIRCNISIGPSATVIMSLLKIFEGDSKFAVDIFSESLLYAIYALSSREVLALNFMNINCALLYYWAYQKYSCISTFLNKFKNKKTRCYGESIPVYIKEVSEGETLESFFNTIFGTEKAAKFALEYVKDLINHKLGDKEYEEVDKAVEILDEQANKYEDLNNFINSIEKSFVEKSGKPLNYTINMYDIVDSGAITSREVALAICMSSFNIEKIYNHWTKDGVYMYIFRKLHTNIDLLSDNLKGRLSHEISVMYNMRALASKSYYFEMILYQFDRIIDDKRREKSARVVAENKSNQLEETNKDLKAKLKESKKKLVEADREIRSLSTELSNYKNRDSLGITINEIHSMEDRIQKLELLNKDLADKNHEANRTIAKRDREINQLKEDIRKSTSKHERLKQQFDTKLTQAEEESIQKRYSQIPLQCFINVIKNAKITVVGGDVLFSKFREYGLDNIKCIGASTSVIVPDEIRGLDAVVVCTSYIGHPLNYSAISLAKSNNIPLIRFNNKNIELLIYELFETLTLEKA